MEFFVIGVIHQLNFLLYPTFLQYEEGLRRIRHDIMQSVRSEGQNMTIQDVLEYTKSAMTELEDSVDNLPEARRSEMNLKVVPTASPRQSLVRLLAKTSSFKTRVESDGIQSVFANISAVLDLPEKPTLEGIEIPTHWKIADGFPQKLFVCCRFSETDDTPQIIVGASQENWGAIRELKAMRRDDRDYRLGDYVGLVENAYNELKRLEDKAKSTYEKKSSLKLVKRVKNYESKRLAIDAMKSGPNQYFLDRTKELGQAFDGNEEHQCCYACRGMLGFQTTKPWTNDENKKTLIGFGGREGHAHACAEVDAALQCAELWDKAG